MFFLIWSLISVAVGVGLIVSSARMFRLFAVLNHYVSTGQALKQLATSSDIDQSIRKHGRLFGVAFVLGAAYLIYVMLVHYDNSLLVTLLDVRHPQPYMVWILDCVRGLLIVFCLFAFVVGALLCVFPDALARFEAYANRWVPVRKLTVRHVLELLAMPRDVDQGVRRHRRLFGVVFVLGAVYSLYVMLAYFNNSLMVTALNLSYPRPFVALILDSLRWSLIALCVFALVVGVMLCFFPDALARVEAYANRWVSLRKPAIGMNTMVLTLDNLVQAFPRTAGTLILVGALYIAANAAILWLQLR